MSVSPFLAAIAGRFVLGERVPARTWVAMAVAFAGIVVMFSDAVDAGRVVGNLLALGVSCFRRRAGHGAAQGTTPRSTCCRR
jgi:drug/metabolite transporter (DMT)-like permease